MRGVDIAALLPHFRGRISIDASLAAYTWFRVGGPADALVSPADEEDLAYLLAALPRDIPVTAIGVGSNLIVRDGGVRGVVVRLGAKPFGGIHLRDGHCINAGAAALDAHVAKMAAASGIDGLAFLRGVPGAIGGALRMNAGAHGGEIKDCLIEAFGYDRNGAKRVFDNERMAYSYRHSDAPSDVIFVSALLRGSPGKREDIDAEMERITQARERSQPVREKTGGSTFKDPPGLKAWQLIDSAGCRGLVSGGAQVSTLHCNFLINRGNATAEEIEGLGEEVRRRVFEASGVVLAWEIKRIGEPISH